MTQQGSLIRKISEAVKNLKKDKKVFSAVIIGLLGMVLILFSDFSGSESKNTGCEENTQIYSSEQLEGQLERFVGRIEGAGQTKVMITFESSQEKIYAKNSKEVLMQDYSEYSKEYILVDSGNEESGLVEYTVYPKIRGVAVICTGADNPIVKQRIITSISALFSLSTNKISVAAMAQ